MWEEALRELHNEQSNADYEKREYEKIEGTKGETIMEKMMGHHFEEYFDVEEARNRDHALDCSI